LYTYIQIATKTPVVKVHMHVLSSIINKQKKPLFR